MNYETLDVRTDTRGVTYVTLNTPERRNVLSPKMIAELTMLAQHVSPGQTRAMVLAGAGPVFCAGGDLNWMKAQIDADRAQRMREAQKLADMLQAVNTMPVPLIGRLHGGAFGGGIGITCICDVTLAQPETKFCFSETRLGIVPATISPYVLARMGEGKARQVFMSARVFDADEAERLGIVSRVIPADQMEAAVEAEVTPYLAVAPGAVGRAKRLARSLGPKIDAEVIEDTIRNLADAWESEEARRGVMAFLEKRDPGWI